MRISLILSLVISLLAVAFALVNNETVAVNIGIATVEGSLALVLLATLSIGVLIGILASLPGRLKARKRIRSLERSLTQQKKKPSAGPSEKPSPSESTGGKDT